MTVLHAVVLLAMGAGWVQYYTKNMETALLCFVLVSWIVGLVYFDNRSSSGLLDRRRGNSTQQ